VLSEESRTSMLSPCQGDRDISQRPGRLPRASLVVIAATLSQFRLPEEGLLLILGIDTFLDMGRSATNVIGNSLATAVVAKWEGQLISDLDTQEMIEEMEPEPA